MYMFSFCILSNFLLFFLLNRRLGIVRSIIRIAKRIGSCHTFVILENFICRPFHISKWLPISLNTQYSNCSNTSTASLFVGSRVYFPFVISFSPIFPRFLESSYFTTRMSLAFFSTQQSNANFNRMTSPFKETGA